MWLSLGIITVADWKILLLSYETLQEGLNSKIPILRLFHKVSFLFFYLETCIATSEHPTN